MAKAQWPDGKLPFVNVVYIETLVDRMRELIVNIDLREEMSKR